MASTTRWVVWVLLLPVLPSPCQAQGGGSDGAEQGIDACGENGEVCIHVTDRPIQSGRIEKELDKKCGNDTSPCTSLVQALRRAEQFRERNMSSPPLVILLHANETTRCRVHFGLAGPDSTTKDEFSFTLFRVTVRPAASSDCGVVGVGQRPDRLRAEPGRVTLNGSVDVHLQRLEFFSSQAVLWVVNSRMVHIDNCSFYPSSTHMNVYGALRIQQSWDVLVTDTEFASENGSLQNESSTLNVSSWNKPVVGVDIGEASNSKMMPVEESVWNSWARNPIRSMAYEMVAEHSGGSSTSQKLRMKMGVYFERCLFRNLGYAFLPTTPYIVSRKECKASALRIRFFCNENESAVIIHNCTFSGNSHPQSSPLQVRLAEQKCQGKTKVIRGNLAVLSFVLFDNNNALLGGAANLYLSACTQQNTIKLIDVKFTGNSAQQVGGALAIHINQEASTRNCISLTNTSFHMNSLSSVEIPERLPGSAIYLFRSRKNRAYYKSGLATCLQHLDDPPAACQTPVVLRNSEFDSNSGFGAVYVRNLDLTFKGYSTFENNSGTSLVAKRSSVRFEDGPVKMRNNSASFSGAIHLAERAEVNMDSVTDIAIANNSIYSKGGGAVSIDRDSSSAAVDEMLYNIGLTEPELCPVQFGSLTYAQESDLMGTNSHLFGADSELLKPAIFTASWHKCFGTLNVSYHPHDSNGTLINVSAGDCWPYFTDGKCTPPDFYASNGTPDVVTSNMSFLHQPQVCQSSCHGTSVVNDIGLYKTRLLTQAAWIIFENTTAACYKQAGDEFVYYRNKCTRRNIFESMSKYHNLSLPRLDCPTYRLSLAHQMYRATVAPILPGYKLLITPWAGVLSSWQNYLDADIQQIAKRLNVSLDRIKKTVCSPQEGLHFPTDVSLSKLTLHPAPGEAFDLFVKVLDEMFNHHPRNIRIQVTGTDSVLLGHNGMQYASDEYITFSSHRKLWSLMLFGLPTSTGFIEIRSVGGTVMRTTGDRDLVLKIPFKLRNCHLGYDSPKIKDPEIAKEYAKNFSGCCRSGGHCEMKDADQIKEVCGELQMKCQCPMPEDQAVLECTGGKLLKIKRGYWAGPKEHSRIPLLEQRKNESQYNRTQFLYEFRSDPFGYGDNGTYASAPCDNGLCNTTNESWNLTVNRPCKPNLKRTGPLCANCIGNYSLQISSEACHDCRKAVLVPFWAYLLMLFAVTFAMFIVFLLINLGMTPTLDSWLFFVQGFFYLFTDDIAIGSVYLSFLTMGLGSLCIKEDLSRVYAKASLLAQPVYLYFFILLLWLAVRCRVCVKYLQRLQKRHTLAHVIWFIVVLSSSSIAYVSLMLLASIDLFWKGQPVDKVAFVDGSVPWFQGQHQHVCIMAIVLLVVLVLPPPIILAIPYCRRLTFLKNFVDEATSIYEPHLPWWPAVNLLRRLLLAMLVAVVQNRRRRNAWMAVVSVVLLALHAMVRPYRRRTRLWKIHDADNKFESLMLVFYSCLCIARLSTLHQELLPRSYENSIRPDDFYLPLYITPIALGLFLMTGRFLKSWYNAILQKNRKRLSQSDFLDDDNSLQAEHVKRLNSTSSSCGSVFSRTVTGSSAAGDRGSDSGHSSDGAAGQTFRSRRNSLDVCDVPCGLREPLLIDAVLNPDGKEWSEKKL